jgi:ABC-type phosphate/phosphonate transport system substrate-binding protein
MTTHTFLVCPHDLATNPIRWQMFAQYMTKKLNTSIRFEITLDFVDFHEHMETADIVYANPLDTLRLVGRHGFVAIAHPAHVYDEAVIVANPESASFTIESIHGQPIASVRSMLPTKIALHMLDKHSIKPAGVVNRESWNAVISAVWRNDVPFGIVYKDTYENLSEQGKRMVQVIATSDERIAFHSIVVGHTALAIKEHIQSLLFAMHTEMKCKDILAELCFDQWIATKQEELDQMQQVVERY